MLNKIKYFILPFAVLFFIVSCDDGGDVSGNLCGDGFVDIGEECDTDNMNGQTCVSLGYYGGVLSCSDTCQLITKHCEDTGFCGDGSIQEGKEQCDGAALGTNTCQNNGYDEGTLSCNDDCTLNFDNCVKFSCGNGIKESDEQCDGTDFGGVTCESMGYYGGNIMCTTDCKLDITGCEVFGRCGDGTIQTNYGEECEGADLNGKNCSDIDSDLYAGSTLLCNDQCHFDTSQCEYCGDGIIQSDYEEECEGSDFGGTTCQDFNMFAYADSPLTCNNNCKIDFSQCGRCGDGILQSNHESCDGTAFIDNACASMGYFGGNPSCDASSCQLANPGNCGDFIEWGNTGEDFINDIAADSSGNIYVVGQTELSGKQTAYVAAFSPQGVKLWEDFITSSNSVYGKGIAVDSADNIYVTGDALGVLDGKTTDFYDIMIVKYTNDGTRLWLNFAGTSGNDYGESIVVDSDDNIYITGQTKDVFNGQTHFGIGDIFLMKFTSDGTEIWVHQWGSSGNESGLSVKYDSANHLYVTGYTDGVLEGCVSSGSDDMFLTKLTSDGTLLWNKQWGTDSPDIGRGMYIDASGSVYVTGSSTGGITTFKFTSDGTSLWNAIFGYDLYDTGTSVTADSGGNIYVSGYIYDYEYGNQFIVVEYNSDGLETASYEYGYGSDDEFYGIAYDPVNDYIYAAGLTKNDFSGYENQGSSDFIIKRFPPGLF